MYIRTNLLKDDIEIQGVYCLGIIIEKSSGGRGGGRVLRYEYHLNNRLYYGSDGVDSYVFKKLNKSDTIIIKAHHSKSFLVNEIIKSKCMGKQPPNGWKELPKCE